MRRGKSDSNHSEICAALRKAGAHVIDLKGVGSGVADIAVLFRGETHWLEIKSGRSAVQRKDATADRQREFRDRCQERGVHVYIVTTRDEALRAIGARREAND